MPERESCASCRHFVNDPAAIENAFKGLGSLSSGYASVRDQDGLCLINELYLSAHQWCDRYQAKSS